MTYRETATGRIRIRRFRVVGLLVVVAAIAVALAGQWPASSSTTSAFSTVGPSTDVVPIGPPGARRGARAEQRDAFGEAGGAVPDGTTVFDDEIPGVAKLDPALLGALRQAGQNGVTLLVDSGWRSPAYQERLLQEAVSEHGSEAEAARWVATPETSAHVSGDAVDIGPSAAAAWLSEHGAGYGLCQVYDNEPWHFELRPEAIDRGCPPTYADPTHDPRMHQ